MNKIIITLLFVSILGGCTSTRHKLLDRAPTNNEMTKAVLNGIIFMNGINTNLDKSGTLTRQLESIRVAGRGCIKVMPFDYKCSFIFSMKKSPTQLGMAYFTRMKSGTWKATVVR